MRFSLIDRILDYREGQGIRVAKTLSSAEEYLADHFPGFPVLPGVLMVEVMSQAGAWYLRMAEDFRQPVALLQQVYDLQTVYRRFELVFARLQVRSPA